MTMLPDLERRADQKLLHFICMVQHRNICGICNLQFITKIDLNEHMQDHTVSFTCDRCNVICNTWPNFQEHIRSIHKHMVFCPYCYKAHTNYWRLRLHWRMHGEENISLSTVANSFSNRTYHIMNLCLHTEPFECELCYYTFSTLSNLREHHMSLHRDVPFYLPFCPVPIQREE